MKSKLGFTSVKHFLLFSSIVLILNLLICVSWFKILVEQIISIQVFLIVLFALIMAGSKGLLKIFPKFSVGVLLGSMALKMVVSLLFVIYVIAGNKNHEKIIVLFFMGNYLLYLYYSVAKMTKYI